MEIRYLLPGIEQTLKDHFLSLKTSFLALTDTFPPPPPHAFLSFSSKTKKFICSIFRDVSSNCPDEWIFLTFCPNVPNRQKLNFTKFGYATMSRFRVTVNNLMVWAKKPPSPPPSPVVGYRVTSRWRSGNLVIL